MEYELKRSHRKTLCLEIREDGSLLVRAPLFLSESAVDAFVEKKRAWVEKKSAEQGRRSRPEISVGEREELRKRAAAILPPRVAYWEEKTGLSARRVRISSAGKRFGSCSPKNVVSLSLYLALYPRHLVDYVIVHELCHTVFHNHSKDFYSLVEKFLPDWKQLQRELRANPIPAVRKF